MRRRRPRPSPSQPVLQDGVVLLRRAEHRDVPALQRLEDAEMARRLGFPGRSTASQLHAAVDRWHEGWAANRSVANFVVCRVADGQPVGGVELRPQGDAVAQLSWWTFAPFRRQGLAARAVRLLCRWGFDELGMVRVEALVEPDNTASLSTARAAGLRPEGLLRSKQTIGPRRADLVLVARLASDPEPPGAPPAVGGAAADPAPAPVFSYSPLLDGGADPGEVVWAWVPFGEDPDQGKDRPVVVVGRQGRDLLVVPMSSRDRSSESDGREWIRLGRGTWDTESRVSHAHVGRLLRVPHDAVRREGAILEPRRFEAVLDAVRSHQGSVH